MDEKYDQAYDKVEGIKAELETYLDIYVQMYKDRRICFSHAKFRYEIEIPEEYVKKEKPTELEFTSQRIGFQRFSSEK
jgi:DNA mismatch repair protein MSH6